MFDKFKVLMSWKLSWGLSFLVFGVSDGHIFFDFSNYWPIINANIFYFAPLEHTVYLFFFCTFLFHRCCHGNPIQNGCLADWGSDVQLALLTPADAPPPKSLQSSQFGRNSSGNHLNLRIRSNGRILTLPFGKIIFLNWKNFVKC